MKYKRLLLLAACLLWAAVSRAAPDLVLLKNYRPGTNVEGWLMSEKLDGVRAWWNGRELVSRQGHVFAAPEWFTRDFPPFELDGELWTKRGDFEAIHSITSRDTPHHGWKKITYNVFEVPHASGGLLERLNRLEAYLGDRPHAHIMVIPQIPCRDEAHLRRQLDHVESLGGEGIVLRNPRSPYETGRSRNALKLKRFHEKTAAVMGYRSGKGKYQGMVGSLRVRMDSGEEFNLGSGLSDADRHDPPPVGSRIRFRHSGFTRTGLPRFSVYVGRFGVP